MTTARLSAVHRNRAPQHRSNRRRLSLFVSLLLVGAALQVVGAETAQAAPQPPAPTTSKARAAAKAAQTGQPVEIPDLTTATSQTFANPDGTLTDQVAAAPVRARHADGSWGDLDFTLTTAANGSVVPAASPYGAVLSGGGTGALVKLAQGTKTLSLSWPNGSLPQPVLSGATATYPNVLPDVDLRASLGADGFSEVLVVKTRQAASNPALAKVRFTTAVGGVTIHGDGNSFSAVDGSGAEIFGSGTPMMWDSVGASASARVPGMTRQNASPADAPPADSLKAAMPMAVSSNAVEVTPSQTLLTGSDSVFPVYIDPSVSVVGGWSMINANHLDQSYLSYDRNEGAKVGFIEQPGDGNELYRSMWRYGTSAFAGKHVRNWNEITFQVG